MNYAEIKKNDVANGPGVRVSLFVSGCTRHCKGCFNRSAWSFNAGEQFTDEVKADLIAALQRPWIDGFSILGGEPMDNAEPLTQLVKELKEVVGKPIWCYSGYTFEELVKQGGSKAKLLELCDVLVDGEFRAEQKELGLRFRGSSNQRVIDLKKSKVGSVVEWEDDEYKEGV